MKNLRNIILTGVLTSCVIFSTKIVASGDYINEAEKSFDKGEYKTAIIYFKNHLKENPEDSSTRVLLGKSYLKIGDIIQADKEIVRAYQLNQTNEEVILAYAQLLLLQKNYKTLDKILEKELTNTDNDKKRLIYQAYSFLGNNQIADAKQLFSELAKTNENVQIYNGLAKVAIAENELEEAEQWLQKSINIAPNDFDSLQIKGQLLIKKNDYSEALNIYTHLIQQNQYNISMYLTRASIKIQMKDLNGAEKDVREVLDNVKNQPLANFILAQIKLLEQNYVEAEKAAQNVLNVLPNHFNSMLIIGISHLALGNYNQADKYLTQYLSENPGNVVVQNMLANVYLAQKNGEQAILILENIDEEKINNNAKLLVTLGSAYLLTGEYKKGIDFLNKANNLEPNSEVIQKRLIEGQLKTGNIDDAIVGLEKIVDSEHVNSKTNYMLIMSYLQKRELQKAENKLGELIQQSPDDAILFNLTAVVEKLKGNNQKAEEAYKKAIGLNKNYVPAYVGLAELAAQQKDWETAKVYFLEITQINPKYVRAYVLLAAISEKQNNYEEMVGYLKSGLEQAKGNVKAQVNLASLLSKWYMKQNAPEKIINLAKELNRDYPNNDIVLSFLAAAQIINNENEQAEQTLRIIIEKNNLDIKHRLLLVELISKKKDYDIEVVNILDTVINIIPDKINPVRLKGAYLLDNKKYVQAIDVANYAEKQFPKINYGLQLKGDIYLLQKEQDKALINYQAAYKLQPTNKLFFLISDLLFSNGKSQESLNMLKSGLKNTDKDIVIHFKMAGIYRKLKQNNMAAKHYLKTLEIKKDNVLALNNLALIYEQEKNPEALNLAKKAYEKAPKSALIIDTYGYIQIKFGDVSEGIKLLKEAVVLSPETYDIQCHLAEGYYLNGETKKAKVLLHSLLSKKVEFSEKENAKMLYNRLK